MSRIRSERKELLDPIETAGLLGVSVDTLAQWRSQCRGPRYIKLERRLIRYRLSDLEIYLAAHAVECVSARKIRES